jgi:hypothetical protein
MKGLLFTLFLFCALLGYSQEATLYQKGKALEVSVKATSDSELFTSAGSFFYKDIDSISTADAKLKQTFLAAKSKQNVPSGVSGGNNRVLTRNPLNGYKYVYIEPLFYEERRDLYNIEDHLRTFFGMKGLRVLSDKADAATVDPCLLLTAVVEHDIPYKGAMVCLSLTLNNCLGNAAYKRKDCLEAHFNWNDMYKPTRNVLAGLDLSAYTFDPSRTPVGAATTSSNEDVEASFRSYFENTKLAPIEGIWKDVSKGYKIAIKRDQHLYKAYLLQSPGTGKIGDVVGVIEESSISTTFVIRWTLPDNSQREGICVLENNVTLKYSIPTSHGELEFNYLKLYPKIEN